MNLLILTGWLWSFGMVSDSYAQGTLPAISDTARNYIIANTILADSITSDTLISGLNASQLQRKVDYFDGLGRLVQSFNKRNFYIINITIL